jgi:hypothetical protein
VKRSISLLELRDNSVREEERGLQMGAATAPATSSVTSDDREERIELGQMEKKLVVSKTVNFWRQP